jgi:hypothetical protein
MEVHHHPHAEKKGFKEYFFEFIMIFLAVTLGFIAENIRENLNNKEQINNNIKSMVGDLQTDIAMYDSTLNSNEDACRMIDSLILYLEVNKANTNAIYFYGRNITSKVLAFAPNTKTFDQMKSSGTLRLISSNTILDSITAYYQSLKWFETENNLQYQKLDEVHLGNSQLFNASVFHNMMKGTYENKGYTHILVNRPEGNPALLSADPLIINSVMLRYHYLYAVMKFNDATALTIKLRAQRLVAILQKEYHLK